MFKIKDTRTGLYRSGDYYSTWSAQGTVYASLLEVQTALLLYERGDPIGGVPDTWLIEEFELIPGRVRLAKSIIRKAG